MYNVGKDFNGGVSLRNLFGRHDFFVGEATNEGIACLGLAGWHPG